MKETDRARLEVEDVVKLPKSEILKVEAIQGPSGGEPRSTKSLQTLLNRQTSRSSQ